MEGITHDDIANAFIQTQSAMKSAGLLNVKIDDDNDPTTPTITRKQAYIDLFKGFIDFHSGYFSDQKPQQYGHAPNQDVYQVRGLATAYRALELLDPKIVDEKTFAPVLLDRAYQAMGLKKSAFNDSYWFSPSGLPLEAGGRSGGGYSSEYGLGVAGEMFPIIEAIGDLASPAQKKEMTDRALAAATIWKHFVYPVYHADGSIDLRVEGAINWRNSKINGLQQLSQDAGFVAAVQLKDPSALRMLQLLQMSGNLTLDNVDSGHYWQQSVWAMEQVDRTKTALADMKPTDARLPHEASQPDYAFVDAFGGAVAIKRGDSHLFFALNWHHGSADGQPLANNIARLHEITPWEDRVVTMMMENPHGFGELALLTYGDLLIAANAGATRSYDVLISGEFDRVFDLVSGKYLTLNAGNITLDPGQSAVLVLTPEPSAAAWMLVAPLTLHRRKR